MEAPFASIGSATAPGAERWSTGYSFVAMWGGYFDFGRRNCSSFLVGGSGRRHAIRRLHRGDGERDARPSEWFRFLRERLPERMVPYIFVMPDAKPLTANGKFDQKALPAPGISRGGGSVSIARPLAPIEEALSAIWREVLHLDCVGVEDSFFDLGGESLQAVQVISRIRGALGVELSIRQFFEAPTIAGLAAVVGFIQRP